MASGSRRRQRLALHPCTKRPGSNLDSLVAKSFNDVMARDRRHGLEKSRIKRVRKRPHRTIDEKYVRRIGGGENPTEWITMHAAELAVQTKIWRAIRVKPAHSGRPACGPRSRIASRFANHHNGACTPRDL